MGRIMDSVLSFFQKDEWDVRKLGDNDSVIQVGFRGDHGEWDCLAVVLEPSEYFLFYSVCPLVCPPELIHEMAMFLHRANYGLNMGNFEMSLEEGEIRFKTSVRLEGQDLPYELCQSMVHHNVLVMDEYMPGIQCLLNDEISAEAAIMLVETPAVGEA